MERQEWIAEEEPRVAATIRVPYVKRNLGPEQAERPQFVEVGRKAGPRLSSRGNSLAGRDVPEPGGQPRRAPSVVSLMNGGIHDRGGGGRGCRRRSRGGLQAQAADALELVVPGP